MTVSGAQPKSGETTEDSSVFQRHANPALADVRPYLPGLTSAEAEARYGVPAAKIVKLSSNENPLGPPPKAMQRVRELIPELHRYPDSRAHAVRRRIAEAEGLSEANVIIGAGSSEIMSFIVRAFSEPGDEVLSMDPSFDVYEEIAVQEGRSSVRMPLQDPFELRLEDVAARLTPRTRVVFVTRPNNPTSRLIPISLFDEIATLAKDAVVVSDEAYIEFAHDYRRATAASRVLSRSNVMVTRTFSKAYGIPNLRIGYALGPATAIDYLYRIKPKWNVGDVAQLAAAAAIDDTAHLKTTLEVVHEGRTYLQDELNALGMTVVPEPEANFVMASVRVTGLSAADFTEQMATQGVLVRGDFHPDYIRVSIGTRADNDAALQACRAILARS